MLPGTFTLEETEVVKKAFTNEILNSESYSRSFDYSFQAGDYRVEVDHSNNPSELRISLNKKKKSFYSRPDLADKVAYVLSNNKEIASSIFSVSPRLESLERLLDINDKLRRIVEQTESCNVNLFLSGQYVDAALRPVRD
jgi:hypothetical protein